MNDPQTILVVEDSAIQAEMLRRLLTSAGFEALVAKDGLLGLEMAAKRRPQLVISDISMPNMDGYELCRAIKSHAELAVIPVILLTELSDPREIIRGLNAGADNYLTKPYDEADLLSRIQTFLKEAGEKSGREEREEGLLVAFAGENHLVTSNRQQILSLLLSTYENAVQRNQELIRTQKALQLLNEHLEEKVRERTRQLEDANRVKSEFVANISHETRTPLNAILGMTHLVLETELNPEQRQNLEIVRQAADSLMVLLNSLLDFSLLQVGEIQLQKSRFSLREHLTGVCRAMAERASRDKGLGFSLKVEPALSDAFIGDRPRLGEVLGHLLDNAVKFTTRGAVGVTVRAAGVEQDGAQIVEFAVSDTGIGIPKARRETIFDSFTQGDGSRTRKFGGTGIGLSLVRRLVELMGGTVWMESEEGRGSRFCFAVPLARSPEGDGSVTRAEELLFLAAQPDHPGAMLLGQFPEDPETLDFQQALSEGRRQLKHLAQALDQGDVARSEGIGQWLKKAAAAALLSDLLKEEVFRLIMAARKEDFAKARVHWENARAELERLGE